VQIRDGRRGDGVFGLRGEHEGDEDVEAACLGGEGAFDAGREGWGVRRGRCWGGGVDGRDRRGGGDGSEVRSFTTPVESAPDL
jgi:hypothetical protein